MSARTQRAPYLFQPFPKEDSRGKMLLVITGIMVVLGTTFVGSSSEGQSLLTGGTPMGILGHSIAYAIIGIFALVIVSKVQLQKLLRFSAILLFAALFALTAVATVAVPVNGGKRWLNLHLIVFQPSEFFKLATVLYVGSMIQKHHLTLGKVSHLVRYLSPVLGGVALILIEPDMGTTSMVIAISLAMLITAGMSRKFILATGGILFVALVGFINLKTYAWSRFTSFLHFGQFQHSLNYQIDQSKIAIGSGGVTGLGFGHSRAKWGLLPNPHTDFIFSILGEEMGLIGALVVIGLFAWFLLVSVRIAARCTNQAYRYVAMGITVWIALEAIINIASVMGWWAVTGIPLPFFSYGGTSLIMELVAVGILYNIANDRTVSKDLTIREFHRLHRPVSLGHYSEERARRHRQAPVNTVRRPHQRY
jgi:cell division protein FtsW